MAEHANPPTLPQVAQKLEQLVSGEISREEASVWASPWVTKFHEFALDDRVLDRKVKRTLDNLAGANSPTTDREFLFGKVDFEAWLQELTEQSNYSKNQTPKQKPDAHNSCRP
jgi:hypothetical protein